MMNEKETGTATISMKVVIGRKDLENVASELVKIKKGLEEKFTSILVSKIETFENDGVEMAIDSDNNRRFINISNKHKLDKDIKNSKVFDEKKIKEFEQRMLDESADTVDVDTVINLYRDYERAKADYSKYMRLMSILKDIINDEYGTEIDDLEIVKTIVKTKIRKCEAKVDLLKTAWDRLMKAISEI